MSGRPTIWIFVGQEPTVLAVGAGEAIKNVVFPLIYLFSERRLEKD